MPIKVLSAIWILGCLLLGNVLQANQLPDVTHTNAVIHNIARAVNDTYIDPEKAKHAADLLQTKLAAGEFSASNEYHWFKTQVNSTLYSATGDSGFELIRSSLGGSANSQQHGQASIESKVLDHNIGYVEISGNFAFLKNNEVIERYFRALNDVDALIIDLRSVDEGNLSLTKKMLGFFVSPNETVGLFYSRGRIEKITATGTDNFKQFEARVPLYILTSSFVTGPWELFSYSLQETERAVIVGEETLGLASIEALINVGDNLTLAMTSAVITGRNPSMTWNEEGVVPDYPTTRESALEKARSLIQQATAY
ncbi:MULTISPECIES: S41 family peptidase [Pseudoalteromonas]|uniref:Tail specific protease domain-containing protein n=1 Tax=Pseudoalteromonas amylolytica TaxID=1859457 RepID=A0A1S1MQH8_9GAMM|nr:MULTISPECIES: S41 family peptidase [Pseudoalteromonas]OHU86492.1 hypothetical protein BFC16_13315 [Pseudoalteromonas sp. JW3]OHU88984.1 hypothetical protein BET10_19445 [Pseudoalteromonas amylolytica]